jgi:AcrR family transcriptional regulator
MPAAERRRRRAPTHERILNQAERLIAVKGVYGFTLRDVAAPLGVQVPAIYKHFKSRDDVLVEVSRRYIAQLAVQFALRPGHAPAQALRAALGDFVQLMMMNPAYARLALVDFATPGGGMEYVKLAAGGSFEENFVGGPLAAMHRRLRTVLEAGTRSGAFRRVAASDVYGLLKASLLIRLVFPDDAPLARRPRRVEIAATERWLWDIAERYLAPRPGAGAAASRRRRRRRR